jgi:hypothetical protein
MVQPAAGYRPINPSNDPPLDDVGGPPPASAPPTTPGRPATDVAATQAVLEPRREADLAIQRRLDAFRDAMTPSYQTSDGYVPVSAAFTMSRPSSNEQRPPELRRLQSRDWADLQSAAASADLQAALGQIRSGRGTPEQIRAIAQALIDQGHAVAGRYGDLHSSIRQTMADHGIGVDCAGYVQQAYLSVTGLDRARARFAASENENLSHLERRGYERVDQLAAVRPGDLVVLGPQPAISDDPHPVGHRAIVYDQRLTTPADMEKLIRMPGAQPFAAGGPIRVFEVDSSWGDGGHPEVGGVNRETWWYSESARQWAWQAQGDGTRFCVGSTPYGHPCEPPAEGFFRDPRRAP